MMELERSPERDAAIRAMLPVVAEQGWTVAALRQAAGPDADLLFAGGSAELVEAYIDLADRDMAAEARLDGLRLAARVRALIAARLLAAERHRGAVKRALGVLALPGNGAVAARCTARTVDAIWHAAGDRAADFSWYTKRATLAAVYASTLLYWLADDGGAATLDFLDRRLAGVALIGKIRRRLSAPRAA